MVKSPVARKALNLDFVSSDYRQRLSVIRAECGLDALPVVSFFYLISICQPCLKYTRRYGRVCMFDAGIWSCMPLGFTSVEHHGV